MFLQLAIKLASFSNQRLQVNLFLVIAQLHYLMKRYR